MGDPGSHLSGGMLLAVKKSTFRRSASQTNVVSVNFRIDEEDLEGDAFGDTEVRELCVYLMSDCFVSMDQQLSFCVLLRRKPCEDEEEEELDEADL